jgi:hypothetical protein
MSGDAFFLSYSTIVLVANFIFQLPPTEAIAQEVEPKAMDL